MAFYQVTSPDVLAQIDEIFKERQRIINLIGTICSQIGAPHFILEDDFYLGVYLISMAVPTQDLNTLDRKRWRTVKSGSPDYLRLEPRRTNKTFAEFYDTYRPAQKFSYEPLFQLILKEPYEPLEKGKDTIGINYVSGQFLAFENNTFSVNTEIVEEISKDEYVALMERTRKAQESQKEATS